MKMSKSFGGVALAIAVVLPVMAHGQANISRPRTGSPVIPGGAALPGGQAVPIADPLDPTPDTVPGLDLVEPKDTPVAAPRPSQTQINRPDDLESLLVSQLQINSLGSIELNQFAAERATNSDVRDFAETLVSDQQHFWRALERLNSPNDQPDPSASNAASAIDSAPSNNTFGRPSLTDAEQDKPTQLGRTLPIERQIGQSPIGQTLPDQFPMSRRPPAQSLTPPADDGVRYGGTLPPAGGETRIREREVPEDLLPRPVANEAVPQRPDDQTDRTMNQLLTIADRAAQHQLLISRKLLDRNEGVQFDKCFISMQLATRAQVLAQLRAMNEMGSTEFREIIQTAEELTQGHLATAERLSDRMEE